MAGQGPQAANQLRGNDPNSLYERFRKRGATKFYGNEGAVKADEWLDHIGDVFETITFDNKQKVVLTASMFQGTANIWWKSVKDTLNLLLGATVW